MTVKELWYRWGWLICVVVIVMITCIWCQKLELNELRKSNIKPEIKPSKCPTCYECNHASEIYAKYIDSLNYGPKKHRERYEDSTRKSGQILRQDYEYGK